MNSAEARMSLDRGMWRRRASGLLAMAGPLLALVCVTLLFAAADRLMADGTFATVRNLRTVTVQTCVVAVAALGMTVLIISGGIDLSAGTALALCATTLAWGLREDCAFLFRHGDNFARASVRLEESTKRLAAAQRQQRNAAERGAIPEEATVAQNRQRLITLLDAKLAAWGDAAASEPASADSAGKANKHPSVALRKKRAQLEDPKFQLRVDPLWLEGVPNSSWSAPVAVGLALLTGIAAGLFNGIAIGMLRIVPFVVTLGTMTIFLGLGNLLSNNVPIRPAFAQIPAWLADLDGNTPEVLWFGFPTGVWLAIVLALIVAAVLRYTVFGRYVFALGSNEATARLCGINVTANKIAIYGLGGLFFGIAGIYQFTRLSTGAPMSGAGLELEIIAAVVIGGGSLSGGRGTIVGTLAGAAMTAVIKSGCTQLGLADALQRIILGAIIILAVTIDQLRQRRLGSGA